VNVLTYHNDNISSGQNLNETALTPANVNTSNFGKLFSTNVDGQVYAQPLYVSGLSITVGPSPGTHNVIFVATEHDSLYAIDADTGQLQWKVSFLASGLPGATSITPVAATDVGSGDLTPEIGITATPVIDPNTSTLFVETKSKEVVNSVNHFVQRLHAINLADGSEKFGGPALIGDTTFDGSNYTYNAAGVWVTGTGDGSVNGKIYFNGLRQLVRPGLILANGNVYLASASHGDNGPYHGWIIGYSATDLSLKAAFNASPDGGLAGIWQSGAAPAVDAQGNLYVVTGNGSFNANTGGHSYGDSFLKLGVDAGSSEGNQNGNPNGFGLKLLDYFTPHNQAALNLSDLDLGSGGVTLLPDGVGSAAHPHLLIAAGKEGTLYLIDRDNMGQYNANFDNVVQTLPNALSGSFGVAAQLPNNLASPTSVTLYYVGGSNTGGPADFAKTFTVTNGQLSTSPTSESSDTFAFPGSTPSISGNGLSNGVVWTLDRGTNQLRAYSASGFGNELYTSGQNSGRDALGSVVKFTLPTVVNGHVYVGTSNALVVYGLLTPTTVPFPSPTLRALPGDTQVLLSWSSAVGASSYNVYRGTSANGEGATPIATGVMATAYNDTGLTDGTTYYYIVRGVNIFGVSGPSPEASTTPVQGLSIVGFSGLNLNGSATIVGSSLRLTDGGSNEASSAFSTTPVSVANFVTQFTFQLTNATADGFTFTIQGDSPTALGGAGGYLGYGGIGNSIAIKFDLYNNAGEGSNSTGLFTGGAGPFLPAIDLTSSGIDLHSGHVFSVSVGYDGSNLTELITDNTTNAVFSTTYANVNIPALVGSSLAYVGFTGGTGGLSATQNMLTWTYSTTATAPPAAPTNLAATPQNGPQVSLTWNNNSANDAGFHIDRATDALFSQNLTTLTAPASTATTVTFVDQSISPAATYYYRVRSFNSAGETGNSNVVSAVIPAAPATPSNGHATLITTTEVDLAWTNNATNAANYKIFRKTGTGGTFNQIAILPANATSYQDMGLSPGTLYDYHIEAWNIAGANDRTGATVTTVSPTITTLAALASDTQVRLSWGAPAGAVTYNVYRGTASGQEAATPIASGLSAPSYSDTGLTDGVTYYYEVTSVDAQSASPVNLTGESAPSNEASGTPQAGLPAGSLDYHNGFAGASGLTLNGSAKVSGANLRLTDGGSNEAGSAFASSAVGIAKFTSQFSFQLTNPNADGFTFTIQGTSPTALGGAGGYLGYAGVGNSVALKFDLYNNAGEGNDSTGLYTGGAVPFGNAVNLTGMGIDLHSGHSFNVSLGYDGATLTEQITDSVTNASFSQNYSVNIAGLVGGNQAFVGFSGGTGGLTATQDILTWTFVPSPATPPAAPTNLTATAQSGPQVSLTWNDNSNNETGFKIDRATDAGFTQNLVTFTAPANVGATATYVDTTVTAGTTYYYRVRATNSAGDSANTNTASLTVPTPPAAPTNGHVTLITTSEVDLAWTDNATTEDGYLVSRKTGGGSFTQIATLPANSTSYADTGVAAGSAYTYQVEAFSNVGGTSGPTTVTATTVPPTITSLVATPGDAQVVLSWGAALGATSYNVYRGTGAGQESSTPIVTGLTTTTYTDTGLSNGTTYYYQVTAVNPQSTSPANPAGESARSNEVSATPQQGLGAGLNFSNGFTGASGLTLNGSAKVAGADLRLTDGGGNEAGSVFATNAISISKFSTQFKFQLTNPNADGFTFTIQGNAPTALGSAGGYLGYAGIASGLAIKFDLYNNAGEGNDSTGLSTGGMAPFGNAVNLTGSGIDLHSGHVFSVSLSYDGTTLTEQITDTVTNATFSQSYLVNIPGLVGGTQAFVGFTGGTGGLTATQDILSWTYLPLA
jgi:fibronectin type 3 domain-containing protein